MSVFAAKKCLVFDLDGTLIPTMDRYAEIAAGVISKYLKIELLNARQAYLDTSGIPFEFQLSEIEPGLSEVIRNRMVQEFESKKSIYLKNQKFDDQLIEMLLRIKNNNRKIIISSNNYQTHVDNIASRTKPIFDLLLGYKVNFSKGKDHFSYIYNTFNLGHNEMVFIGDSIKDYQKAKEHHIEFIGIEGTFDRVAFKKLDNEMHVFSSIYEMEALF